ncbi:beta strand repeat-containing protein [Chondromyces apiculatus]|uniref:Fibronectin type-III domain-containing protein n=1 Tax=Chondromyces apiculatus DSM 436 TaxID=1192034 RepID=A0A017T5T3_9BACT|nr:MYXO-CTERM sorting domain-containing protein [Chondromyces apiculatus]EYF04549.1 Hypothetical protein CAP_4369 [Chondromyces apiculatus DSM 436]
MHLHVLRAVALVLVFFTSFGALAAAPTVTTSPATSITTSSANLNGAGNPNGEPTTGWFRISSVNPGACNDTFGTRVPANGGTDLGAGAASVPYSILTTGLTSGVTYYFCAIVSNASGTAYGGILSFTVPGAPAVTTTGVSSVTSGAATLEGSANPNSSATTGWFRYSTTNPGTCDDTFGTRAPSSSGSSLGSGTSPVAYTRNISGLTPGATYYYCAISSNTHGTSFGTVLSFTALANAPVVTTGNATLLTGTTAQLNGSGNPGGAATTGWFRYSTVNPGTCNDTFGTRAPTSGGSSLGAGNTAVSYALGITGLTPATTYYYCAIAQNTVGLSVGSVNSFTTPAPPTVVTTAASSLTSTSAYLNGTGTPNGSSATGWFRYSFNNPGTCDDTFGSRAPTSGGTSLGASYSGIGFSQPVSGLSPGTTYYFCAIASNLEGLAFGAVLSFTTPNAPTATTSAATLVTSTTATLNGSGDPNGDATYGYFRYATVNPGTCSDSFGTRAPTSSASDSSLGAGTTDVTFSRAISGLTPSTTYYFCAITRNNYGTVFGAVLSLTTLANPPTATTGSATLLTGTTATLNGSGNPGGAATTGWFRFATASPGTCNDSFGTRAPAAGGSALGAGNSSVSFSQGITGLTAGTTYYYCAITQNSAGLAFGSVLTFTTPTPPTVVTTAASSLTNTSAYLNGAGTPNGSTTTGWFRYSPVDPGTCNDTFGSRAPTSGGTSLGAGYSSTGFSQPVSGLSPGTTYYFCAIVSSFEGTAFGAVLSFTTPNAPTVTSAAATLVTSTTATLNGSGDPNLDPAFGYFRYATVNPGACSDSFGTRAPTSSASDSSLGAGTSDVAFSRAISGLTPATTYYFCAIVRNNYGTVFGAVLSLTTLATQPTVTTGSATLLTGATAQLNASGNPGGAATTGWFRYSTVSPGTCNDTFGTRAPTTGGSSLGSGTSTVSFSQGITGLSPSTTYYYCAITQNAVGTALGSVLTFTTPTPPAVTTTAASSLTNTSAYLNGAANPNGSSTSGWFRYSLNDPGTCDDTFGSRAPTSGGTALGAGNSALGYSQQISGLSPGTTYYFCAIAASAEGTSFGAVLSFTTPAPPTVTTVAATLVTSSSATLNGSADPNGDAAYAYFRYATVNPGLCSDSFGARAPTTSSSDTSLGAGTSPVAFSRGLSGLSPGTTYYYCAIARNNYGTTFGAVFSFTTLATQPIVTTGGATSVTTNAATLNASANPSGDATTGWFRYATASPGTCNDTFGTRAPVSGGSALGSGTSTVSFSQGIAGLTPGTTYYYCAIGQNGAGTTFGSVLTFTTTSPPTVATLAATPVTATTATLNGSVNPNGFATSGWFRYSTSNPGACDTSFGTATGTTSLGSGASPVALAQPLVSLSPATTYYFCAIAQSSIGTTLGAVLSFTTPAAPPSVLTVAASDLTATSATINATINPNGSNTTGWFRYSLVDPGTCNDSFGTRAPASGGFSLGGGNSPADIAQPLSGLTSGTTYYYCALAQSTIGVSVGTVLTFTTASAPSVTTVAASAVTNTGATLNGSATPNGSATTGWFRYATVDPGTCNDSFGTRAPATGGASLGSGSSAVAYAQAITGLAPATTYYFCALVQNGVGTSVGAVLSFTTPASPSVTTVAASNVTGTGATLNGSANPNLSAATGWFRYSTTEPASCNDSFGTRAPTSGGTSLGSGGSAVAYAQAVTGLSAGTTYYYCAIASNPTGTSFGAVMSFTTASAPSVTTVAASAVTSTGATLNGAADPNFSATTGFFRYSTVNPGSCNNSFGTRAPTSGGPALGAGSSPVDYAQPITGLSPGTTYYYCALATNTVGTGLGTVLSFTTPAAPSVTSAAATAVTSTGATLTGAANPNGSAATGWFRYATVNPGSCNDAFGTRAPASGGTSLGAGSTSVPYAQAITGLAAGTTYYFCAIADSAVGVGVGTVLSFTTAAAPSVTTVAASAVTSTGATLNGSANPSSSAATGWFRYATVNPGTCDDSFGTRAPASGGTSLGSGSSAVAYSQAITGLAASTTYYYCAIAQNAVGTSFGAVLSFSTPAAPSVTTVAASNVTATGATLNGAANPNGSAATGWFRYSTSEPASCNDTFGTRAPTSGGTSLGSGSIAVAYTQAITGLASGATYYYCAIASNVTGTSFGAVMSFTTASAPSVTTVAASAVTSTGATLNGAADPNLSAATGFFRYSTVNPGSCNNSFGTRAPTSGGPALGAGSTPVDYAQTITGLSAGTTYYFCALAQNALGTGLGTVLSFTTPAAPSVTSAAATAVTSTGATLNGSADPNFSEATGWFRYATVNPGSCSDAFGTRAPAASGAALGDGSIPVAYAQAITGLTPGATYYFCAIAQNAVGTSFGAVLSFTTPAAPSVTTAAASTVTSTSATLNGSATPGGSTATGWFRYAPVNPGSCDDTFGTRAPSSGGTLLGSGSSAVSYAQSVAALSAGTTYYYCAIAQNAAGTSFGAVMSFTTAAPPSVTTVAATAVTSTGATVNGSANPNQLATNGWFRYSAVNPGTCDDSFGTRAPTSGGTALGSGSSLVAYSRVLTGLAPDTTYYYCAIASNSAGTSFGAMMSFTTPAAPSVTTVDASAVTSTSATLDGSAIPNLSATTGWFRYSTQNPGNCSDAFGTRAPAAGGTALGNGTSPVAYTQAITGLTPGATYYFCAIAQNAVGTSFGAVLSFTTTAPPSVVTEAAAAVTSTSATLAGTADPNQEDATGWFRYGTNNPGSCNDAFGTRAPASGGTALGDGTIPVGYTEQLTGLTPGTTYYYCAIADNVAGTGFGAVLSFTTPGAPSVTTQPATAVMSSAALLHGAADPNLDATTGWFRYDTVDPGTCDDAFGTRAPMAGGTSLGAGSSPVTYAQAVSGLAPMTTYYYCAIASNGVGTSFGAVLSFTTSGAPDVTTEDATDVEAASATLHGTANPNQLATTAWFRYDTTEPGSCDDTFGTRVPASGGTDVGAGDAAVEFTEEISGLLPGTTYYFCAIAENQLGTSFGEVLELTTAADLPSVITEPPTNVAADAAELNGSANPNGGATTGWFRYDTTDPGACDDSFGTRAPASGDLDLGDGATPVAYAEALTGLSPGVTYYYCAIAANAEGTAFGEILSFTAGTTPPEVTTEDATDIEAQSATIAGTATPNGVEATGWFRYDDTDPGDCDDAFGTRVPASGGVDLGAGSDEVAFTQPLTDLEPSTTYYYCAAASNDEGGAVFGEVLSFTTDAAPPEVTTLPPTVDQGTATLNGAANPLGSEATAWFRFDAVDPGECNDTFGTRAPAADGAALGAGRDEVAFSEVAQNLTPGTYYVCAIASNDAGVAYGEVLTFEITGSGGPSTPPGEEEGGCGCHVVGSSSGRSASVASLVALLLLAFRRRRRA